MIKIKPVSVARGAFLFCKIMLSVLVWAALIFQSTTIAWISLAILVLSALLGVDKAPFILLYTWTFEKLKPSGYEMLDKNALRFAHLFGSVLNGLALLLIYLGFGLAGWIVMFLLAVAKTSGACGHCSAVKLYGCMNNPNGKCCRFSSRWKNAC